MKHRVLSVVVLMILLTASVVQAEELVISTGSGPLDSVIKPVQAAFEKESGIKLHILFGSASLAFKQFYSGVSDTGIVGTSFDEVLAIMKKEGFDVKDPGSLRHVVLGRGMIRTVVNRDNPVTKLSGEQLKGIFSGKIANWKEVGGKDAPIIIVLSTLNPATVGAFKKAIMGDLPFTREVLELGHMDELLSAVEANSEAIAFGTSTIVGKGVRQVETPDVFRQVTLLTKGEPSPKVQKFIDFVVTGPGKKMIRE